MSDVLRSSLSSLTDDTINEIVLANLLPSEEHSRENKMRRLDSLQFQQELIEDEREEVQEGAKKKKEKEAKEKEKEKEKEKATKVEKDVQDLQRECVSAPTSSLPSEAPYLTPPISIPSSIDPMSQSTPPTPNPTVSTSTPVPTPTPTFPTPSPSPEREEIESVQDLTVQEIVTLGDLARGGVLERERGRLNQMQASIEILSPSISTPFTPVSTMPPMPTILSPTPTPTPSSAHTTIPSTGIEVRIDESREATPTSLSHINDQAHAHVHQEVEIEGDIDIDTEKEKEKEKEKEREARRDEKQRKQEDKSLLSLHGVLNNMLDKIRVQMDDAEKALGANIAMNALDKDGDGQVSREELVYAVKLLKRSMTDEEADKLVRALDTDGDGRVSVAELLAYAEERKKKAEIESLLEEESLSPSSPSSKS